MNYQDEECSSISITEVLRVAKPHHVFCRLLGLEPFAIDPNAQKLHRRCWHKIVSCVWLSVEIPVFFYSTISNYTHLLRSFKISTFIVMLMNTAVYIISLTTVFTDMCGNPQRFSKILRILRYCDDQLSVTNNRKRAFKAGCLIWLELALVVTLPTADVFVFRGVCFMGLCGLTIFQIFRTMACAVRFSHLAALVWLKLRVVNRCLRGMHMQLWDSYAAADGRHVRLVAGRRQDSSCCATRLLQLRSVVCALREMSQLVVVAHQPFIIEALLFILTATSFLIFKATQSERLLSWNSHLFWATVLALVYVLTLLLLLVVPAHCATVEARRSRQLVTWLLMDEQLRAHAHRQLCLLAQQLAFRPPAFHMFSAVAVDLGLLFSVISTLSTFTVLLFTFK